MNPLTGVLAEAWGLYRRFAAHFFAISFVPVSLVWVAFDIALGLALVTMPARCAAS